MDILYLTDSNTADIVTQVVNITKHKHLSRPRNIKFITPQNLIDPIKSMLLDQLGTFHRHVVIFGTTGVIINKEPTQINYKDRGELLGAYYTGDELYFSSIWFETVKCLVHAHITVLQVIYKNEHPYYDLPYLQGDVIMMPNTVYSIHLVKGGNYQLIKHSELVDTNCAECGGKLQGGTMYADSRYYHPKCTTSDATNVKIIPDKKWDIPRYQALIKAINTGNLSGYKLYHINEEMDKYQRGEIDTSTVFIANNIERYNYICLFNGKISFFHPWQHIALPSSANGINSTPSNNLLS